MQTHKLTLCIMFCVVALSISDAGAQTKQAPAYSLKTVESNPIPSKEHFALWTEVALGACADSTSRFNLSRTECQSIISRRAETCIAKYKPQTPAVIHTSAESRSIGRNFMYCATPYYFCNGVEVRTEAEVRATCK